MQWEEHCQERHGSPGDARPPRTATPGKRSRRARARWGLVLASLLAMTGSACGGADSFEPVSSTPRIGTGPRYRPPPAAHTLAVGGRPIGRLRCSRSARRRFGVHLEIFARRLDVVIPAGIGIAPPRIRRGAYVRGGRCWYPVRTREPTGLIEVEEGTRTTLGAFFAVWGQALSPKRVVGFSAPRGGSVSAFVDGKRWRGDPRLIPLTRHAAIVLEVGGYFPPTRRYVFPPSL
jgi:hypothetical protein